MRNPFFFGAGGVVSADIAMPDHESQVAFYRSVLTTGENPLWRDDLMNNEGTPVIGLGERTPEYSELPLQWVPHFQVADIAASVQAAIESDGKELLHSKTDAGQSQWALVEDPFGAAVGLIPPVSDEAGNVRKDKNFGRISWWELGVTDITSGKNFYEKVIGWTAKDTNRENTDVRAETFDMWINEERIAAEIYQRPPEPENVSSVWMMHLPVADFAESLRLTVEGGGTIIEEFPESGSAIIRDPVGVYFAFQSLS